MKNNLYFLIILLTFFENLSFAENYRFETSKIDIVNDENKIIATDGTAYSNDNNIEIKAKKFEYFNEIDFLKAFSGSAFIKSDNLVINFDQIELNKNNSIITASGNVKIIDTDKELEINSKQIIFNKDQGIIQSPDDSILKDKFKNIFETKSFSYDTKKNILKIKKANFKDTENNNFFVDLAYINIQSEKLFGKDIIVNLNNKSFNKDNEPRLKGRSISYENQKSIIKKGVFTTCKKRDDCPPWELSAEEILHDKKTQIISYKNAWLKVYDKPVVYFPKFFHPDPTVKRKSGFLIPTLKSSPNADNFLSLPYFHVISSNKDLTFTPRLYSDNKILFQSEYRQENSDSSLISDFSIFKEKDAGSKNHFFYNFSKKFDFLNFDNSLFNFKLEKTSNDTYLKANKINSPIINSYDVLENNFQVELSKEDLSIDTEFIAYESLDKDKSDRYEFILPKLDISKKIVNNSDLDGEFNFNSSNLIKNYQTNIFEKININNLIFNSKPKITNLGFYNNYDFIIKNVNSDSQNSKNYKENENYYLSGLFQFNSSFPLIKEMDNQQNVLKPKISLKIAPNDTKNLRSDTNRLDVNNLFNLDRVASNDTLEGGISLAYGNDFTIIDKDNSRQILSLKLANNIRLKENDDLPTNNQVGLKTSNFFSEIEYSPNEILKTTYKNSFKNNAKDVTYENFITEISLNNFVTTFDYLNENNTSDENSYLKNTTQYVINDSNNLLFSTRINKKTDLTEYYNLMYQYKNDCLAASIEYNKDYYEDSDITPEESIFFKLTIIPFGASSAPIKN